MRTKFIKLSVILVIFLTACSTKLEQLSKTNILPANKFESGVQLVNFGSSSFLIEAGNTQIMIDGFVTRHQHRYFGKIRPNHKRILDVIEQHNICPMHSAKDKLLRTSSCWGNSRKQLLAVIPTHAHYDHALDSSYFAAWAETKLYKDRSIMQAFNASKADGANLKELRWDKVKMPPLFDDEDDKGETSKIHLLGDFKATFIKSEHTGNIITNLIKGKNEEEYSYPAHLWTMKEGTSISVLIKYKNRSFLIVPSAGPLEQQYVNNELDAEVVLLGIGGLGLKSKEYRAKYWDNIIKATGARRIIPIHWDNDQVRLPLGQANFDVAAPRNFDATLRQLKELAARDNVQIIFSPAEKSFDPFVGLSPMSKSNATNH